MAAACVTIQNLLILLLCSGASGTCPYARHLNVSAPNLEALRGSCLLIPCTFTIDPRVEHPFDPTKHVRAIWSKNEPYLARPGDEVYLFYSSDWPRGTSLMTMIGELRQKNCTTLFSNFDSVHSDKYFFRIENDNFKATSLCNPLQITVKESPWRPSVQVSGLLKEKESVTITCSAQTPCPFFPPKLLWNLQQDPPLTTVTAKGTFTTFIQETRTLSDQDDGLQINCEAVYPVNGGEKRAERVFPLTVMYSPKNTAVQLSANTSLSVGQSVNLSCSSRASPQVHSFTWFRVTSEGPQRVHEGQVYSLIFSEADRGEYFCQAKNEVGEENSAAVALQLEGMNNTPWDLILGGGVGLLILICGALFIWRLLSKRQTPKEPETEIYAEVDRTEDEVHYGEIDFTKSKSKKSTAAVQKEEDLEETVYSQVQVTSAQHIEDLYATVKKS